MYYSRWAGSSPPRGLAPFFKQSTGGGELFSEALTVQFKVSFQGSNPLKQGLSFQGHSEALRKP